MKRIFACAIAFLALLAPAKAASNLQIAIAVDSYMNGVTDTTTEINSLVGTFLPPQIANAIAHGYDPTTYGSEALGLALSGYKNFPANWAGLSETAFKSNLSTLSGVNPTSIQGWLDNWEIFYVTNGIPPGLTLAEAVYGATFGDAFGVVLNNPTFNSTIIQRNAEINNAVRCFNAGTYVPNVAITSQPSC